MITPIGDSIRADDGHHCGIDLEVYANANQAGDTLVCWAGNCAGDGSFFIAADSAVRLAHALLEAVIHADRGDS